MVRPAGRTHSGVKVPYTADMGKGKCQRTATVFRVTGVGRKPVAKRWPDEGLTKGTRIEAVHWGGDGRASVRRRNWGAVIWHMAVFTTPVP
jgi:hypothetical protein